MGDSSDFYAVRGPRKRVVIEVKYISGRKELHDFGTKKAANASIERLKKMPTVKNVKVKP